MKRILTLWMNLFILCFSNFSSHAQTIINRNWLQTGGTPNGIYDFQASHVIKPSNAIVVVGNTFHYGQAENFLISKYNGDGGLIFQKEYDGAASTTDFATDVTTIGNDIYVTGVEGDTVSGSTYITTLKLDSVGNIVWTAKYQNSYKKYNLGFRIVPDATSNVLYVCGTSQTGASDFALTLIKYKTIGGSPVWTATYDSIGLYDAGIDLKLSGGTVLAYGISGLSSTSGDIITRSYNVTTGALISQSRINNTGAYVTRPVAIAKDNAENIYLAGISNDAGKMDDIQIVKLDSLLNLKWRKTIDGGNSKNDGVTAIKIDSRNNVILTGFAGNANGSKAIWTLKMRDSVIVWNKKIYCTKAGGNAQAFDGDLDRQDNIYVTGTNYNGIKNDQVTYALDSNGNVLWGDTYAFDATSNDQGRNIKVDSGGAIIVYGRDSVTGGGYKYSTMKFTQTTAPLDLTYDTSAKINYAAGQMLIRFNPNLLTKSFVNNKKLTYTVIDSLVPDSIIVMMNTSTGADFHGSKIVKIFPFLSESDSISITRLHKRIAVPQFWADFLIYPVKTSKTPAQLATSLSLKMPKYIFKCELNTPGRLTTNSPNDPKFTSNLQKALCDATRGIDACVAWGNNIGYAGSSAIKIGHFDTGIKYDHQDFQINGNSVVADGFDFYSNTSTTTNPNNDVQGHGTETSSIYGAVSDNNLGISSVAGGDGGTGTQGVSIYNLRVANDTGGVTLFNSKLFEAYVKSAILSPIDTLGTSIGYGTFINNHSYVKSTLNGNFLLDGIRWCFQNGITNVAASGNDDQATAFYPASFYDDWILKVGGCDETGSRWSAGSGVGSTYGNDLDIVAPATNTFFNNISYCTNAGSGSGYGTTDEGTSLAAPFATGAAALILGYIGQVTPSNQFSAPEDIEHLLQFYTKDIASGYTSQRGWGRLNIGNVFSHLAYPRYKVRQNFNFFDSTSASLLAASQSVTLKYSAETHPAPQFVNLPFQDQTGTMITYTADVYKLSGTVIHTNPLDINETIVTDYGQHAWVLNSSSNMWGLYNSSYVITPEVDVSIANLTTTQVDVEGYTYHFTASSADPSFHDVWLPFNPFQNSGTFAYSIHTFNSTLSDINEEARTQNTLQAYPNPTSSELNVSLYTGKPEDVTIHLVNLSGQVVYSHQLQNSNGTVNLSIPTAALSSGMYILSMQSETDAQQKKIVVTH